MEQQRHKFVPKQTLLVLFIALAVTAVMTFSLYDNVADSRNDRFTRNVTLAAQEIQDRIETYIAILRGTKAFFVASRGQVSRDEFSLYVDRLALDEKYPGIQGVGFARAVPRQNLKLFKEGITDMFQEQYTVWPDQERDWYLPIVYLEPRDLRNRAAIGYDMMSEEKRRKAIERARDTGRAAATNQITLVQEIDEDIQPGFLIYLPVYNTYSGDPTDVINRQSHFVGTIYSPFRVRDLFNRVLNARQPKVNFVVYESQDMQIERQMFQSENYSETQLKIFPRLQQTRTINLADQEWTVQFTATPDFENRLNILLFYLTALAGILLSFLLAWLTAKQERIGQKLALSEQKFRTVFNLQFQFMAVLSPDGRIMDINELPLMVGGVSREDVLGEYFWECKWWEGLPKMQKTWPERIREAAETQGPVLSTDKYRASDGSVRLADAAITAVRDGDDQIMFFIVQAHDITDRETAQRDLRDEKGRLEQLNALMLTMAATLDRSQLAKIAVAQTGKLTQADGGVFIYFPNQKEDIARYEVFGMDKESFVLPAGLQSLAGLDICFNDKPYLLFEEAADYSSRKELLPFLNSSLGTVNSYLAVPVTARNGKIIGGLFFANEKRAAFTGYVAQILEGVAAQLSVSLENAKLYKELSANEERYREMAEQAETANHAKSEFLAKMSHEIRTPMNVITGLTNALIENRMDGEKREKVVTAMRTSTRQLTDLINDVLDISKIEAQNFELHKKDFYIQDLLKDVVDLQTIEAERKGLRLELDYDGSRSDGFVHADDLRLRQVLINMIGNAVKFTRKGHVTVTCALKERQSNIIDVTITVQDTGIGIPKDKMRNIFDKFTQADNSITREYGGSGLGLTICHELVEFMGGDIQVESAEGQGTTFKVYLPLEPGLARPAIAKTAIKDVKSPASPSRHDMRILLVDDHEPNILVASHMLEGMGYTNIDVASTGTEAIEKAQNDIYDLILMDLQMPNVDGITATQQIRAYERDKGQDPMRIVGITAHALADDRRKCLDAGMDDYLAKPFSVEDMKRILKESQKT